MVCQSLRWDATSFGSSGMGRIERSCSVINIIHSREHDLPFFVGLNGNNLKRLC